MENFKSVLEKHVGVFAWTYKDLKGIKPELCQHYIDLEPEARLVCQQPRRTNPVYEKLVKAELTKLVDVGFIYPVA